MAARARAIQRPGGKLAEGGGRAREGERERERRSEVQWRRKRESTVSLRSPRVDVRSAGEVPLFLVASTECLRGAGLIQSARRDERAHYCCLRLDALAPPPLPSGSLGPLAIDADPSSPTPRAIIRPRLFRWPGIREASRVSSALLRRVSERPLPCVTSLHATGRHPDNALPISRWPESRL